MPNQSQTKYTQFCTNSFLIDLKKASKQNQDLTTLDFIKGQLEQGIPLDSKYRDHQLTGQLKNYRECHIKPDFLLVYRYVDNNIIYTACGSHSYCFERMKKI